MEKQNTEISRQSLLGFLLLYSIVVVCYLPVFSNGFLSSWDDQWMVTNLYTENGWTLKNLREIFTQSYKGQYSPLVQLNYIMLYTIFGYEPFWFHFTNVAWHCGCMTLTFLFIRQLLKQSNLTNSHDSLQIAYLAAFLFAIHPVNVETVAWISAVKVSMYTFFYLLALLLYLRYVRSLKITYYIIAILCFVGSGLNLQYALNDYGLSKGTAIVVAYAFTTGEDPAGTANPGESDSNGCKDCNKAGGEGAVSCECTSSSVSVGGIGGGGDHCSVSVGDGYYACCRKKSDGTCTCPSCKNKN